MGVSGFMIEGLSLEFPVGSIGYRVRIEFQVSYERGLGTLRIRFGLAGDALRERLSLYRRCMVFGLGWDCDYEIDHVRRAWDSLYKYRKQTLEI